MSDPVLVEATRGRVVESRHRGAMAVADPSGRLVAAIGDVARPVFPRSAIKAFQALPLIESGAADRFGFGDAELALAISSHNGEERHVATARRMLAAAGLDEGCLLCGPQWPERERDRAVLHRMGARPGRIHNNCSGKHAGFLCAAVAMDHDTAGYVRADHPTMREIVAAVASVTATAHDEAMSGIDGCSIPTYAVPLQSIAAGFARFATGEGMGRARAAAAARLRRAAAAEPFMVAGSNRACTRLMDLLGEEAFVKVGAEAVYTAALPRLGLGVALKIEDGSVRAAEVAVAAVLAALLEVDGERRQALAAMSRPQITSRAGEPCGELRPSDDFEAALASAA